MIPGDEDEDPNADFDGPNLEYGLPPISSDPPLHTWTRRLLLPWFSHKRVDGYVPMTRGLCTKLLDGFADSGQADAAADYAQQIPVRVIAHILGVSPDLSDTFTGWVRDVLEFADDAERRQRGAEGLLYYFVGQLEERRANPGDDLLSELLTTEVDGKPVDDGIVLGMAALALIAGVDTTWSAIGSSLWHLAAHPEDRKRLVAEPELMPTAIEELLRAYSPVTMAREVTEDVVYARLPHEGRRQGAHELPGRQPRPRGVRASREVVQLDRAHNRHVAFGSGIHRCAGSNLARMELQVALEEWLARIPGLLPRRGRRGHVGRRPGPRPPHLPGGVPMKLRVDPDKCQGHARCYGLAPEIFDVDDYGLASVIVDEVPPELEEKARLAVANCPEYAIEIVSE